MHCKWYASMLCSMYSRMLCSFPGPHPGGKLRGLGGLAKFSPGSICRPAPWRGVQGGSCSRGFSPMGGACSRWVCSQAGVQKPPVTATAAAGMVHIGMHYCFIS